MTNVTEERPYDTDGDGLIEITTLAQLEAVRHDRNGDGVPTAAGASTYRAAFPDAFPEADSQLRCVLECRGYELMEDLDFDTDDGWRYRLRRHLLEQRRRLEPHWEQRL